MIVQILKAAKQLRRRWQPKFYPCRIEILQESQIPWRRRLVETIAMSVLYSSTLGDVVFLKCDIEMLTG